MGLSWARFGGSWGVPWGPFSTLWGVRFGSRFRGRFGRRFGTVSDPILGSKTTPKWPPKGARNEVQRMEVKMLIFVNPPTFFAGFCLQLDPKNAPGRSQKWLPKPYPKKEQTEYRNGPPNGPILAPKSTPKSAQHGSQEGVENVVPSRNVFKTVLDAIWSQQPVGGTTRNDRERPGTTGNDRPAVGGACGGG